MNHKPATLLPLTYDTVDSAIKTAWTSHPETKDGLLDGAYALRDELDRRANAYPELIERAYAAPKTQWTPDKFVGFSEEQIALIKRGWDAALNQVFEENGALLRRLGEES